RSWTCPCGAPRLHPDPKVSSLGKDWHKFCLKCERCNKTLTPGGHAEHDGKPFCHKPCYATLFGPKGTSGRCLYPAAPIPTAPNASQELEVLLSHVWKSQPRAKGGTAQAARHPPAHVCTLANSSLCMAAEKVTSLGKDWHRPCLRCEKCNKTLTSGGHAEHDGKPYCNHPCYAALFGPKGRVNWGCGFGREEGVRDLFPSPLFHPSPGLMGRAPYAARRQHKSTTTDMPSRPSSLCNQIAR
uniref:LIM zinc-binding domain-containing protein n=2 Tax=Neognathae TaxID=8825 RepID=A0A8C9G5U6_PAVCR